MESMKADCHADFVFATDECSNEEQVDNSELGTGSSNV